MPIAGLLTDLAARGLLDSTLVIWGGEFGRLPIVQKGGTGRDHNPHAFTTWLAGGGVKGGVSYGETDEIGLKAVENKSASTICTPRSCTLGHRSHAAHLSLQRPRLPADRRRRDRGPRRPRVTMGQRLSCRRQRSQSCRSSRRRSVGWLGRAARPAPSQLQLWGRRRRRPQRTLTLSGARVTHRSGHGRIEQEALDVDEPDFNLASDREKPRPARPRDAAGHDVVFYSPVVHTPQVGKAITKKYLSAASQVFFNDTFHYARELMGDHDAVLEFELESEGIKINGVDLIKRNDAGKIVEFKVMLRPLKAVNLIHEKMGAMLQANP